MSETDRLNKGQVIHPFAPVCGPGSRILILGSMPSEISRRQGFYYGNPQNRFWQVLASLLGVPAPAGPDQRRDYLLTQRIALWDVLRQCTIIGSQDGSIRDPLVNDISALLVKCPIRQVFTNGQAATRFYQKYCQADTGRPCVALPSTSPANGRWSLDELCRAWQPVREALLDE